MSVMTFIGFFHQKKDEQAVTLASDVCSQLSRSKVQCKKPQLAGMLYQELDLPRLKEFYKDLCCAGLIEVFISLFAENHSTKVTF